MLDIIIGLLIMLGLGIFAAAACWLSSGCCRYDGYKRKNDINGSRKTKK
jgi:hypothetical protein